MRDGWERPIINASSIRAPRIWQFLELFGLSTGIINMPMTFPVQPLNGYMVSGMLSPDGTLAIAYPEEVQQVLREQRYVVDLHIGRRERELRTGDQIIGLADDLIATVQGRARAALQLLDQRPTTFFALVFVATDRIQHAAWCHLERLVERPEVAQEDPVCQRVLAVYQEIDQALGSLLSKCDDDTTVIVMSDHGFCGLHTRVYLNKWLAHRGWLAFKGGTSAVRQRAKRARYLLKKLVPRRILLWGRRTLAVSHTLNWASTQAYSGNASENAIFINVKGREPAGAVALAEYQRTRSEIVEGLGRMRDPRCELLVMDGVHEAGTVYQGPFLDLAPDIILEPAEGYEFTPDVTREENTLVDVWHEGRGIHTRQGILIAAGAGVQRAGHCGRAEIVDVAPTVLHQLGLPVPAEMDGRVLEDLLHPDWLAVRPPQRVPLSDEIPARDVFGERPYTLQEQRLLEERLGDLGYLE